MNCGSAGPRSLFAVIAAFFLPRIESPRLRPVAALAHVAPLAAMTLAGIQEKPLAGLRLAGTDEPQLIASQQIGGGTRDRP